MEELKRALSVVTGYQIDKYILIDMYAFIDVVDLIGGIDVHLDEAVIDPTYKTYDGGKWGTLYYRAGDHHLSGKQALRLARSRHTSSDFARSKRQHMLLEAIREKFKTLGIKQAGTLKKLGETILSKTETDINIADAITYFARYQNYTINAGHTLSTANVLTSQYTGDQKRRAANCTAKDLSEEQQKSCNTIAKGEYILLPRESRGSTSNQENWNPVRWYIRQIIEGK